MAAPPIGITPAAPALPGTFGTLEAAAQPRPTYTVVVTGRCTEGVVMARICPLPVSTVIVHRPMWRTVPVRPSESV